MNLIDESFETKKTDNSKKMAKIILIFIAIIIIAIIGIFAAIVYMQGNELKLYVNGIADENVKTMMVEESDGTIYFPIKEISSSLGYQSFNGEYTNKSEDASKCYIQNENETANFSLNSNKIYKLNLSNNTSNYDYFYADKPVKALNGKLYATSSTIEDAFNISFTYDKNKNNIYIYTLPYLVETYAPRVLDYGYEEISDIFTNQKAILESMLVVTKDEGKTYGVIDVNGNDIIEPKYSYIEYLPNSGDFLVQSNNKVGIISSKRETKVQLLYDSLELIDKDSGLYLARKDNKYGIIDSKGSIKIYIEYDQIGIDVSKFEENDIKNKYLLDNGMIPVKKGNLWGAYDKNGNLVLDLIYDSFGYIASTNKDAINLLIIPNYNVLVASRNKKYTLINSVGKELCMPVLDDVYMTISSGNKHYYMSYGDNIVNVEDFFAQIPDVQPINQNKTTTQNDSKKNNNIEEDNEIQGNIVDEESNELDDEEQENGGFTNVEEE